MAYSLVSEGIIGLSSNETNRPPEEESGKRIEENLPESKGTTALAGETARVNKMATTTTAYFMEYYILGRSTISHISLLIMEIVCLHLHFFIYYFLSPKVFHIFENVQLT